jgi:hypothetical protein
MKFQRPAVGSRRKRFAWLPRRVCVVVSEYRPMQGWTLIPFVPGWNQGIGVPPGHNYSAGRVPGTGGGMVASPVTHVYENELDGWMWLEWFVEELKISYDGGSNSYSTRWEEIGTQRQWNLWYEYI